MHPFVSFVIMPIFALANAGVAFIDMDLQSLFSNHVALGVMFGLLLGKPLGIVLAVWLLPKLGLGKRSKKNDMAPHLRLGIPCLDWFYHVDVCCLTRLRRTCMLCSS